MQLTPEDVSYYPKPRGYRAASAGELTSRDVSHCTSQDGGARASGSLDSSLPPSGVAARPKSRPVAAEPTLLDFANKLSDSFWDGGADVIVEAEFEEGEVEEDREGRDDEGAAANPLSTDTPAEKVISIFKEVFQRAYSSGCYKAQASEQPVLPMGSLSTGKRATKSQFLPAYPPVHWVVLRRAFHRSFQSSRSSIHPASSWGLLTPASFLSTSTYVNVCLPGCLRPSFGSHRTSLLAGSSLCRWQCPASFILLAATLSLSFGSPL